MNQHKTHKTHRRHQKIAITTRRERARALSHVAQSFIDILSAGVQPLDIGSELLELKEGGCVSF
jgi:hypothetical protein